MPIKHSNLAQPLASFYAPGAILATALLCSCIGGDTPDDLDPANSGTLVEQTDDPPLEDEEIAQIRSAHVVASLPLGGHGQVDIVNTRGPDELPDYAYIVAGDDTATDVFEQLLAEDATPAEIFVTLTDGQQELPETLLADHNERVRAGTATTDEPRQIPYTTFRTIAPTNFGCEGSSYSTWVSNWRNDWADYWESGHVWNAANSSQGTTYYTINATNSAKIMTACDASGDSNGAVVTYQTYYPPQVCNPPVGCWVPFFATRFGVGTGWYSVHLYYSDTGGFNRMGITHDTYDPSTYVGYGYCANGYPC